MKFLILLLIVLSVAFSRVPIEVPRLQEYKENALEIIDNIFHYNINNLGSRLQAIFQNTFIKDAFSNQKSGLTELQCEKIMKKFDYQESTTQEKYQLIMIVNNYCKDFQNSQKIQEFPEAFLLDLRKDSITSIHDSFMALYSYQDQKYQQNLVDVCDKLNSYLVQDGTGKLQKRSEDNSYQYSSLIFEMYEKCITLKDNQAFQKKMGSQLKIPMGSTLLNTLEIAQSQFAVLEKDRNSIETTARIVRAFKSIFSYKLEQLEVVEQDFKQNYEIQLLRFLKSQEDGLLTYYQKYHLINLYQQFNETTIPFVRQLPALGSKKYTEIHIRWETLMGQIVPQEKANELNKNLNVTLLNRQYNIVQSNLLVLENDKNQEWNSKIQFDTANINDLGFYILKFENNKIHQNFPFTFLDRIYLVTKVKCDDLQFEVTQNQYQPGEFSNRLKEYEKILMPVKLSGDKDWVHFKFRLDFDRERHILPKFVGISLLHPNHGQTSSVQQARYDSETNYFHVKLQLSDQNVLLPYSNTYEVQLMVSDQKLRENIAWKFAKFQIKYQKPRKEKPPSDLDYKQLPEIRHTFKEPQKQPAGIIVGVFCITILAVFFMYIIFFSSVEANTSAFPSDSIGKTSNLLFVFFTMFMLGLLIYYWIALNLYQIILILLCVTVPYMISGRYALSFIEYE